MTTIPKDLGGAELGDDPITVTFRLEKQSYEIVLPPVKQALALNRQSEQSG